MQRLEGYTSSVGAGPKCPPPFQKHHLLWAEEYLADLRCATRVFRERGAEGGLAGIHEEAFLQLFDQSSQGWPRCVCIRSYASVRFGEHRYDVLTWT